jgi:hypothetical protein
VFAGDEFAVALSHDPARTGYARSTSNGGSNLALPYRRAAWLLMSERPTEAAALTAPMSDALPVLAAAAEQSRLSNQIGTGDAGPEG